VPVLLFVWIGVAVLAVFVLGVLAYGLVGAAGRLNRELRQLERDVQPLLADARAAAAKAAEQRAGRSASAG
jgi:hypothetical protein